jgi:hypothetical protein
MAGVFSKSWDRGAGALFPVRWGLTLGLRIFVPSSLYLFRLFKSKEDQNDRPRSFFSGLF